MVLLIKKKIKHNGTEERPLKKIYIIALSSFFLMSGCYNDNKEQIKPFSVNDSKNNSEKNELVIRQDWEITWNYSNKDSSYVLGITYKGALPAVDVELVMEDRGMTTPNLESGQGLSFQVPSVSTKQNQEGRLSWKTQDGIEKTEIFEFFQK